jgi:hypothetical protein
MISMIYFSSIIGSQGFAMLKMKSTIFWDVTPCILYKTSIFWKHVLPPSLGSKDRRSKQLVLLLFSLIFDSEDEAVYSSETSLNFYQTIRGHNPEASTLTILVCFINGNEYWFLEDNSEYSSENKNVITCEIKFDSVPCFILSFGFGCQFYCSHVAFQSQDSFILHHYNKR